MPKDPLFFGNVRALHYTRLGPYWKPFCKSLIRLMMYASPPAQMTDSKQIASNCSAVNIRPPGVFQNTDSEQCAANNRVVAWMLAPSGCTNWPTRRAGRVYEHPCNKSTQSCNNYRVKRDTYVKIDTYNFYRVIFDTTKEKSCTESGTPHTPALCNIYPISGLFRPPSRMTTTINSTQISPIHDVLLERMPRTYNSCRTGHPPWQSPAPSASLRAS